MENNQEIISVVLRFRGKNVKAIVGQSSHRVSQQSEVVAVEQNLEK